MLGIELGAIERLTVPVVLNWPARLNSTVWASIQVRLVACAGEDGLRAEPERTRSVAEMSAGLTFPEKVTVIDVGDVLTGCWSLRRRRPRLRSARATW